MATAKHCFVKKRSIQKIKEFLQYFKDSGGSTNLSETTRYFGLHHSVGRMAKEMGLLENPAGVWKWVKGNGKVTMEMAQQVQELSSQYANAKV